MGLKTNIFKKYQTTIKVVIIGVSIIGFNILKGASNPNKYYKKHAPDSTVVGTWISDEDSTYKLVFINEHTCQKYISNHLFETDSVILSNTSPQCGITVPVTVNTTYMQFINKANHAKHYCFEITGLDSHSLAFRPVDLSGPVIQYYRR